MTSNRLRLLYLSYAFPPGISGRFPALNPAGHATETQMTQALARQIEISSVGTMAREIFGKLEPGDNSIGLQHELLLWDRRPELWHRWRSWWRLRRFYVEKATREGPPDVLLVKNLGPVYNYFVRWLRRQSPRPVIVLLLADAGTLGQRIPFLKRLRYAFKPMATLDEGKAIGWFDACISFGLDTRRFFEPRGVPWLWMPSAFNFRYDPPPVDAMENGPIRFGYFGTLGAHSQVIPLARAFLDAKLPGDLHLCGHGVLSETLKQLAQHHSNIHFDGLLPQQSDCLVWAQKVDVLVNPRPPVFGLENSFPSKIFEYAMTGKAILSTPTGGVETVLGTNGLYFGTENHEGNFEDSLRRKLCEVAAMNRAELQKRGTAVRERILKDFNWDEQARRMIEFLTKVVNTRPAF